MKPENVINILNTLTFLYGLASNREAGCLDFWNKELADIPDEYAPLIIGRIKKTQGIPYGGLINSLALIRHIYKKCEALARFKAYCESEAAGLESCE